MNEKENEKKNEFIPTQKQIKFSETYLNYMKPQSNKEIAEKVGIDTSTIWRWFNNPDFLNWLNDLAKKLLEKSLSKRYMVAIREAEGGNYNFSKLLLQIEGEFIPLQKIESKKNIKFEDKTKRSEDLSKELIDQFNLMRSRIPLRVRKAYLEKELKKVNKAIGNGETEVKIKKPHELREALTMEEGN